MKAALIALAFAWSQSSVAQTVTDGDTIKLNGTTYRLWGIDAPEMKQWCGDYPAGVVSAGSLELLTRGKVIVCEHKATDRYGRTVAVCRADGEDLSKAMVQIGMAWAFTRYSRDYVAIEERARSERIGIHSEACEPPWEWRAHQRR